MDERRDPEQGSHPQIASGVRLSPIQEAWGAYVGHATRCDMCRSLDAGRCEQAEALYRAYQTQAAEAYRRLGEATD